MHRVLLIQEILSQILDELRHADDKSASRRNSDIVAFALASKDILELALDKIWCDLPSFTPLVLLFGNALRLQLIPEKRQRQISLQRNPTPEEWDRVLDHSRRVRQLVQYTYNPRALAFHDSVINSLKSPPRPLFPQIRSIKWPTARVPEHHYDLLSTFLSNHLVLLDLEAGDPNYVISILEIIMDARLSMPLRVFRANVNLDGERLPILLGFLKGLTILEEFGIQYHSPEIWPEVARLPSLRKLSLHISTSQSWSSTLLSSIQAPFPLLELLTITINHVDLRVIANFLRLTKFNKVITLSLNLPKYAHTRRDRNPGRDLPELVDSISRSCSPSTLRNLSISLPEDTTEEFGIWDLPIVPPESLRPLLKFHQMRTFTLASEWNYELDDEFFKELHSSWPFLEKCYLAPNWILS